MNPAFSLICYARLIWARSIRASSCTRRLSHLYDFHHQNFKLLQLPIADEEGEEMLWLLVEWDDLRVSIIPAGWLKEPLIPANSSAISGLKVPFMGLSYWGKKAGKLYKVKVLEMNGKSVRQVINLSYYFTSRPYTESKPILEKRLKEEMREGK